MNWKSLLQIIGPGVAIAVATMVPGGAALAPLIVNAIAAAQQLPGATGPEKKAHALELIQIGAQSLNAGAQRPVIDPAVIAVTAGQAIDAVVGAVKVAQAAHDAIAASPIASPPSHVTVKP